ncbi:MAG TPA: XdhC/CoxI family protein [Gemmatimonadales bacterium]|nr:XdhC/CoxI family protein [Gemmatimonadales bacterium]
MRDLLNDYDRFARAGKPFGRAVVTSVWGSAPRPEGSCMLAAGDGVIAGSVSGGCVESATALEIEQAIARGSPKLVTFGVTDERAWEVGLACGGTIKVFVEPSVSSEVIVAARSRVGEVVATVIGGTGVGTAVRILEDGNFAGRVPEGVSRESLRKAALAALSQEASTSREFETDAGPVTVFLEVFPRQPRLVIFGGVQIAVALVPLAKALGYRTIVADGRPAFMGRERFPEADELILAWPEEAFDRIGLDSACYVCVLSHDPKFDEPALQIALRSPAAYVGAIGSRKTQNSRRERLREAGLTEEQIGRLHGPIGLDLGGRQPAETALAILAQMTTVRYKRVSSAVPAG